MNKCNSVLRAALVAIVFLAFTPAKGQNKINYVGNWYYEVIGERTPATVGLFSSINEGRDSRIFHVQLDNNQLASLLVNAPAVLNLTVPYAGTTITLNLARVNVSAQNMNVITDKGEDEYTPGLHYRGIVNNNPAQIASVSFFNGDVMGGFSTDAGNFVIGKVEDGSGDFCVYNEKDLGTRNPFDCLNVEDGRELEPITKNKTTGIGCKTINVYFECDYALFQSKGSVNNTVNYVAGLFNQVSTLYANENIAIQISDVFVWTSIDPYASYTQVSAVKNAFSSYRGANYNGDIAHLLTPRSVGGGVATVNTLCYKSLSYGASGIYTSFNTAPTYSWTVQVVTHELGHNIGSPHTQNCFWPGGALDNCVGVEGGYCNQGPSPIGGGTIMSYCHLTSFGINFNNGFGQLPGDWIRQKVANASCVVGGSGITPSGLSMSNISSTSAQLSWNPVSGASQYNVEYKLTTSTTWLPGGTTTGNSLTINGLSSGSNYVWHVSSDCSANSYDLAFTTLVSTSPTYCATPSGLNAYDITETAADLSWSAVAGASNYTVEYKLSSVSSWTTINNINSNSVNLSGLSSGSTYNWRVMADCSVGFSSAISFSTLTPPPPPPPAPTGCSTPGNLNTMNITIKNATLTWAAVPGALGYQIKFRKQGAKTWSNYNNVNGNSFGVTKLSQGTTYEWIICSKCSGSNSSFTQEVTFTTPSQLIMGNEDNNVKLYPNPANNVLNVFVDGWDASGTGEMYNMQGARVNSFELRQGENTVAIDGLANGMYVLYIKKDGQQTITRKFIKSDKQ